MERIGAHVVIAHVVRLGDHHEAAEAAARAEAHRHRASTPPEPQRPAAGPTDGQAPRA